MFPSIENFCKLMTIDYNFQSIVENASSDYFDNIPKIKVTETYPDACEELDGLFRNATGCLMYEDEETSDYHIKFYKAVRKVF